MLVMFNYMFYVSFVNDMLYILMNNDLTLFIISVKHSLLIGAESKLQAIKEDVSLLHPINVQNFQRG